MTIRFPSLASVLAILVAVLAVAGVVWWFGISEPSRPASDASLAVLRDSLTRDAIRRQVDLQAWADSVVQLRGDSLAAVFSRRAAALRPRVVRIMDTVRDTTDREVLVRESDLRTVLVSDSTCWDSVATLAGAGLLRRTEDSARVAVLEDEVRSLRRSRWWWAGGGFVAGRASCLGF